MKLKIILFLSLLCWITFHVNAQPPLSEGWLAVPNTDGHAYGVYYFRKNFILDKVPPSLNVNVSGDTRYKLFINGQFVCLGPARSDVAHWNYDVVNLASYVHVGKNVLVAKVWNEGVQMPVANTSYQTAFMLEPAEASAGILKTDESWKCIQDPGYAPKAVWVPGYYGAGPGEIVNMSETVKGWKNEDLDMSSWQKPLVISPFIHRGISGPWGVYPGWHLQQSSLPGRELKLQRLAAVREATGVKVPDKFLEGKAPLTVPAHSTAHLVIDQKVLTNAYTTLIFSGGNKSTISLGYAEALYRNKEYAKGNRDQIKGKFFVGRTDSIISDGDQRQNFTTMMWRTYRYLVVNVKTKDQPLVINDLYGIYTGFPFQLKAKLYTSDTELQKMMDIGWRTAKLCAVESYADCPYYEQLQYFGDSRIQALVSLYMTGDDRLVKNLYNMADWSRNSDGVIQSRYPSSVPQWIPPYALHYIYSLHDYMMYGKDMDFLKDKLMTERTVLNYFHHYQMADGRVKNLPGWNFTDWVYEQPNWENGVAKKGKDGCNCVMDFQLLYAYQQAASLEKYIGMTDYAVLYEQRADQLEKTIQQKYWRPDKGLYSDRSDEDCYSQHANAFALLTGMVKGEEALRIAKALEKDSTLAPASIYFKYYIHEAMVKAGLGDDYLSWLDKWRENMRDGLTTWCETSDVDKSRSDCHAWGASPNIEFMRTVLGIDSDSPAFQNVLISPHLGKITHIGGIMPHPEGAIAVEYTVKGAHLKAVITLPEGIGGRLVWKGHTAKLQGGKQEIEF